MLFFFRMVLATCSSPQYRLEGERTRLGGVGGWMAESKLFWAIGLCWHL